MWKQLYEWDLYDADVVVGPPSGDHGLHHKLLVTSAYEYTNMCSLKQKVH